MQSKQFQELRGVLIILSGIQHQRISCSMLDYGNGKFEHNTCLSLILCRRIFGSKYERLYGLWSYPKADPKEMFYGTMEARAVQLSISGNNFNSIFVSNRGGGVGFWELNEQTMLSRN